MSTLRRPWRTQTSQADIFEDTRTFSCRNSNSLSRRFSRSFFETFWKVFWISVEIFSPDVWTSPMRGKSGGSVRWWRVSSFLMKERERETFLKISSDDLHFGSWNRSRERKSSMKYHLRLTNGRWQVVVTSSNIKLIGEVLLGNIC